MTQVETQNIINTQDKNLNILKEAIAPYRKDFPIEFYAQIANKHREVFELIKKLIQEFK